MGRAVELEEEAVVRAAFEAAVRVSGMTAFARRAGVSVTSVSRAIRGDGMGVRVPAALGWEKVTGYVRMDSTVVAAAPRRARAKAIPVPVPRPVDALPAADRETLVELGLADAPAPAARAVPVLTVNAVTGLPDVDDVFSEAPVDIESAVLGARVAEANAPDGAEGDDE